MKNLCKVLQRNFDKMCKTGHLFRSSVGGRELWQWYLMGFDKDPVFRDPSSSLHNCNNCHNFINRYGNVVALDENLNLMTIFDDDPEISQEYTESLKAMRNAMIGKPLLGKFVETFNELNNLPYEKTNQRAETYRLGLFSNTKIYTHEEAIKFGIVKEGIVYTFDHMHLTIPRQFIDFSGNSTESIVASTKEVYNLLKRALSDISEDCLETVIDLIDQGALLDAESHKWAVNGILNIRREYNNIPDSKRDYFMWLKSVTNPREAGFRGLIRELCLEISEKGLEVACVNWNKRVDPRNYMRAVAPISQTQINQAMKFIQENGYEESFTRRCATLDDIKVSDILYANAGDGKVKKVSIFDGLKPTKVSNSKLDTDNLEEISIEKFMTEILPKSTSVEVYFQGNQKNNLVTLTTAENKDSKEIMKWHNNFSWTYNGNLAGKSQIKAAVKAAGGFVDAPFRFSILWNDQETPGFVDFDAHAMDSRGNEIYYSTYKGRKCSTGGQLDIDMIRPSGIGVENIYWENLNNLSDGTYRFWVHNYDGGENQGIKAEIVFGDSQWTFKVLQNIKHDIEFATIVIKNRQIQSITPNKTYLVSSESSHEEVWGIETNKFHQVNMICPSPNFWGENAVGNKQYFFMIPGCKAPDKIRSFHNENLISDLQGHRKVLDALGAKLMVESSEGQLSGLGFDATVRDTLIVKVNGVLNKVIKIKF